MRIQAIRNLLVDRKGRKLTFIEYLLFPRHVCTCSLKYYELDIIDRDRDIIIFILHVRMLKLKIV